MGEPLRVALLKMADRLYKMRTLRFIAMPYKRRRIGDYALCHIFTVEKERSLPAACLP